MVHRSHRPRRACLFLGIRLDHLVHLGKELRTLARVERCECRCEEGNANRAVLGEEMVLDNGHVATQSAIHERSEWSHEGFSHSYRIHPEDLWMRLEHNAKLRLREPLGFFLVDLQLATYVVECQHCIDRRIDRSIDVCSQLVIQEVIAIGEERRHRNLGKHIVDDLIGRVERGIPGVELSHERVAYGNDLIDRSAILSLKEQESLVLELQVLEGKLHRTIGIVRSRQHLGKVFLKMYLCGKESEESQEGNHRRPIDRTMCSEIVIYLDAELCHNAISPL